MQGEYFHISLTDDVKLFCVNTPRSIPIAYRDKLRAELDILHQQNIITPVTEATEWCAPIECNQSCTPAQAVADIAATNAKFFTVLDALKGYHQCPLDKDSQVLIWHLFHFGALGLPYGRNLHSTQRVLLHSG